MPLASSEDRDETVTIEETAHLVRSARNRERLLESIDEIRCGGGVLLDLEQIRSLLKGAR